MRAIQTDGAPLPLGHYSQAVVHNGLIFVSTQLPIEAGRAPDSGLSTGEQARLALHNVLEIVRAGGGSRESVLRVTVYLADIASWAMVNAVYEQVMEGARPARGVVQVAGLHHDFKVAMDAVAAVAAEAGAGR